MRLPRLGARLTVVPPARIFHPLARRHILAAHTAQFLHARHIVTPTRNDPPAENCAELAPQKQPCDAGVPSGADALVGFGARPSRLPPLIPAQRCTHQGLPRRGPLAVTPVSSPAFGARSSRKPSYVPAHHCSKTSRTCGTITGPPLR